MSDQPGEVVVLTDADALAVDAADRLSAWLAEAEAERGVAHVALTGGSSATGLYKELRARPAEALDWSRVHLWWGDDRYVPLDHPDSNAGTAYSLLGIGEVAGAGVAAAERVPVPAMNVHPMTNGEGGAARAAERYEEEIRGNLPADDEGRPIFDVILLGMGPDGHILSVFPGSAALEPDVPAVMPIPAPNHVEPHVERVTLTPGALPAARHILVMVPGAAKAEMVRQVLEGERDPRRWPARLAVLPQATWLLDTGSAAQLKAEKA
ncbi:MAG: 6-phosphogluconolactonase [Chloroflexi bacterium]|nr:6-phosphogluconolactonase [Chloroflexota bacterium]MDQ3408338.1 6-phosphogluconolactonase [Chloroflexota bacterium]